MSGNAGESSTNITVPLSHAPSAAPPSYEVNELHDRIATLERQVASLLEAQKLQQSGRPLVADPPMFDGKNWFWEWRWKMYAKLRELEKMQLSETTKIDYIVSRMTGRAVMDVSIHLPPRGKAQRVRGYRTVDTADALMDEFSKVFS